jgi:hypothetical protein
VNDILLEQQKMIYAPPSREKSKQTVRSPMLEKAKTTSIGSQLVPSDEYSAPMTYQQQHTSNTAGGQRKKTGPAPYAASGSQVGVGQAMTTQGSKFTGQQLPTSQASRG